MSSVQVIIPCYNYGHYLRSCVESALCQDGVDVNILIIDDCSSDDSVDVCRELSCSDKRVAFISHEVNKGHIATYNEGLKLASSDYLVLLSADDLLTPGALFRATNLMDRNPSVGMVYGHPITFQGEVPTSIRTKISGWNIWHGTEWIARMCQTGRNFIVCPEVVMRTSIQHKIGYYDPALPHSGDMEMWLRVAAVSDIGRVRGVDQACYRNHSLSMQRTVHAGLLFDLNARLEAFQSAFNKEARNLPNSEQLLKLARNALARTAIRQGLMSIKCSTKLEQPIEAYKNCALALDPNVVSSKEWKSLDRAQKESRGAIKQLIARHVVDITDRIIWRQWRRSGIYQSIQ